MEDIFIVIPVYDITKQMSVHVPTSSVVGQESVYCSAFTVRLNW